VTQRIIKKLGQIASTNGMAMELALQGAPAGTTVVAEGQSGGRGRLQRQWFSPSTGGLYFSVIERPKIPPADMPAVALGVGVAVCRAIEKECNLRPALKWPNDLLLSGRKVGGILCETGSPASAASLVVIGVGINVAIPAELFPTELRERAISLTMLSSSNFSLETLLQTTLAEIDRVVLQMERDGVASIFADWRVRDGLQGQILSWVATDGRIIAGKALGLDDHGRYRIQDEAGKIQTVLSGDLHLASSSPHS
jgi:BirA family biotin operon repressor/biotin-[acetyl-CoA-carboxylase] ligase